MSRRDAFALGSGFGALFVVAAYHLACRYTGRHFLAITTKENQ